MAENLNVEGKVDIEVAEALRRLKALGDEAVELAQKLDETGKSANKLDKAFADTTGAQRKTTTATGEAAKAAEKASTQQKNYNRALGDSQGDLSRTRYALYDVASSYAAISAATLGAVAATGALSIAYESAFTNVERTTLDTAGNVSANIGQIKNDLLDLSEQIPLSFQEITNIATLGAQLGIAEQDLAGFTDTVAKFAATTNVTVESAAQSFGALGELLNVPADQFNNLGSAIALVGINSVATESEILSVATQIAAVSANAGLGADYVVGLAGALASLRVPAEQSRGALTRTFAQIERAVGFGGEELDNFAELLGMTASEAAALWNTDAEAFFDQFLEGLSGVDNMTLALDKLNLSELRVTNTLTRLAQNLDLVNSTQADSTKGITEGVFLNDAFAVVVDDVASQFRILLNAVGRFLAEAGLPMLEFLRVGLPLLTDMVQGLTAFAETAEGQAFFRFAGFLTTAIGLFAAFRAAISLATASTFALVTATSVLGGTGLLANIRAMAGAVMGIGTSAGASATAVGLLAGAFTRLFRATVVLGLIATAMDQIFYKGEGTANFFDWLSASILRAFGGVLDVLAQSAEDFAHFNAQVVIMRNNISAAFPALRGLMDGLNMVNTAAANAANAFRDMWGQAGRDETIGRIEGRKGFSGRNSTKLQDQFDIDWTEVTEGANDFGSSLDDIGTAAAPAAERVRTLVDYASDLGGVFGRAFDLRFGNQDALDDVTTKWLEIADASEDAANKIRDARLALQETRAEIATLVSDRRINEYFLTIAEAYDDELRAGELRAKLGEIDSDLANKKAELTDEQKALKDAQDEASKSLTGNSRQSIKNRQTVLQLLGTYQEQLRVMAENGASQEELTAKAAQLRAEFVRQATQAGFSANEINKYAKTFDDLAIIIANVPRNLTVSVNANPAIQALREYEAAAKAAASAGRSAASIPNIGVGNSKGARQKALEARIIALEAWIKQLARSGNGSGAIQAADAISRIQNQLLSGNYATGGYTGAGGKYEPAGIVHRGEYVVPKSQVNQATGLPYANALGQMQAGSRPAPSGGYANGGFVSGSQGSAMMVELSPYDRKLLMAAGNIQLKVGAKVLASTVNGSNYDAAQRGIG